MRQKKPETKKSQLTHPEMVLAWIKAMETGLLKGKVSPRTVEIYKLYAEKFFERHSVLSIDTLKKELATIHSENFAKRKKIFKALVCLAKYLNQEGCLPESFLDNAKPLTSRRHLPPQKATVTVSLGP